MSKNGPRYSIIPHEFFSDTRLKLSHIRIMAALCRHTNVTGWCRLKQRTIGNEIGACRQTVNRVLADLVKWGHIEVRVVSAGNSKAYRVLMDSKEPPPADLPETEIDEPQEDDLSPTDDTQGDVANATGVSQHVATGVSHIGRQQERTFLTYSSNEERSEDSKSGLEVKGAPPAPSASPPTGSERRAPRLDQSASCASLPITPRDPQWQTWLEWLPSPERTQAMLSERITASSRWPGPNIRYAVAKPPPAPATGLSDRSRAMTGEGA